MKNNKKTIAITLLVTLILTLTPTIALAGPTELDMNWDGLGIINVNYTADDDALMNFYANGWTKGDLYAKDSDNNPYNYGVDNFDAELESEITNGGYLEFAVDRTDSKESSYGPADQSTLTWIGTNETAQLNYRVGTNFAQLRSSNYGWHSSDQFLASGNYEIHHSVTNGDNNAYLHAVGLGSADIDHMSDDTGNNYIKFGKGSGCYTNADTVFTGAGVFELGAHFDNSMTMGGWTASGPVDWTQTWSFGNGFSIADHSFEGY